MVFDNILWSHSVNAVMTLGVDRTPCIARRDELICNLWELVSSDEFSAASPVKRTAAGPYELTIIHLSPGFLLGLILPNSNPLSIVFISLALEEVCLCLLCRSVVLIRTCLCWYHLYLLAIVQIFYGYYHLDSFV